MKKFPQFLISLLACTTIVLGTAGSLRSMSPMKRGAVAFTNPLSVTSQTMVTWLDFTDLTKNTPGLNVDGTPTTAVLDQSANAYSYVGAVNQYPLYKTNIVNSLGVLRWDGTNDYLKKDITTDLTAFTIYANVYSSNNRQFNTIISSNTQDATQVTWEIGATNALDVYAGGIRGSTGSNSFTVNAWHRIALTYTSGDGKIYIDNTQVGTFTNTGYRLEASSVGIGYDITGVGFFTWQGDMADIAIWSGVLTTTDLTNLYTWSGTKLGL